MEWEVVIGIETHTQLKTESKIFSGASTNSVSYTHLTLPTICSV